MNNLAFEVVEKLKLKSLTIATAESLTAGLVSANLAGIEGASKVFKGGIIAYQNEVKENILKIDASIINKHSSVSREVASLMAENVRKILNSDLGVATTGVAGPGLVGDKKIGTVFVALSSSQHNMCLELNLTGDRQAIRQETCTKLFELILEKLV
ncbi:MAG: hypothetical protein RLZZ37_1094 [Actinomycetota bacterium]